MEGDDISPALRRPCRTREQVAIEIAVWALRDIAMGNVNPGGYRARAERALADIATLLGETK